MRRELMSTKKKKTRVPNNWPAVWVIFTVLEEVSTVASCSLQFVKRVPQGFREEGETIFIRDVGHTFRFVYINLSSKKCKIIGYLLSNSHEESVA